MMESVEIIMVVAPSEGIMNPLRLFEPLFMLSPAPRDWAQVSVAGILPTTYDTTFAAVLNPIVLTVDSQLRLIQMKNGDATPEQLNYGFRRVLYNTMVAATAIRQLRDNPDAWTPEITVVRVAALIMARNLDEFFYPTKSDIVYRPKHPKPWKVEKRKPHKHEDDIDFTDFTLSRFSPTWGSALLAGDVDIIHKIAGHIVAADPGNFGGPKVFRAKLTMLIRVSRDFIHKCIESGTVQVDPDKGAQYLDALNDQLEALSIPVVGTC